MLPRDAFDDQANSLLRDAVPLTESGIGGGALGVGGPDGAYIGGAQFGSSYSFSAIHAFGSESSAIAVTDCLAPFRDHVSRVAGVRRGKDVIGAPTGWVIACMASKLVRAENSAVCQFPRQAVNVDIPSAHTDHAVVADLRAGPLPTSVRGGIVGESVKTLDNGTLTGHQILQRSGVTPPAIHGRAGASSCPNFTTSP